MVIILRGPSGAGKSTYAAKTYPGAIKVSADDFFMVDGEYKFDPTKLSKAHGACMRKFIEAVQKPDVTIVVDNTNTTLAEVAPYAAAALAFDHELEIVTFVGDYIKAAKRNVHLVPATTVMAMAQRIEEQTKLFPPWWKHSTREY